MELFKWLFLGCLLSDILDGLMACALLPGQGGILDCFDSFLFAAAAYAAVGLAGQWLTSKFH
jgi:hypothetical protein